MQNHRTISQAEAVNVMVRQRPGERYTVRFTGRSDGRERTMVCANQVRRHLSGGKPAYDAAEHGLLRVWSFDRNGYRSIPCELVHEIHAEGVVWHVTGGAA